MQPLKSEQNENDFVSLTFIVRYTYVNNNFVGFLICSWLKHAEQ